MRCDRNNVLASVLLVLMGVDKGGDDKRVIHSCLGTLHNVFPVQFFLGTLPTRHSPMLRTRECCPTTVSLKQSLRSNDCAGHQRIAHPM
jgi:hypothetical protein